MKLAISIITYNRSACLEKVLDVLSGSVLRDHTITVLDNCSTDDTAEVARGYSDKLPALQVLVNKINIGPDANFLRAVELSDGKYTWVLCDDDAVDLSNVQDVLDVIEAGTVDLIHVGAHPDKCWNWFAGKINTPRAMADMGYPYFKFSSFMPCNIFRTSAFTKDMIKAYKSIAFSFPHMPFFVSVYEQDKPVYVAQNQIVTATLGSNNYSVSILYYWWMRACGLLQKPADRRRMFLDQWRNIDHVHHVSGLDILNKMLNDGSNNPEVKQFIMDNFTAKDKLYMKYAAAFNGGLYDMGTRVSILGKRVKNVLKRITGANPKTVQQA